jgi:hypothetical protein
MKVLFAAALLGLALVAAPAAHAEHGNLCRDPAELSSSPAFREECLLLEGIWVNSALARRVPQHFLDPALVQPNFCYTPGILVIQRYCENLATIKRRAYMRAMQKKQ